MTVIDLIVQQLTSTADMLKMTLSDFSDAELLMRPAAGANHPLFQLGHLAGSEAQMNRKAGIPAPELPFGFAERFHSRNNSSDDPKTFGATKQELLDLFDRVRAATIAHTKTLTEADLDKPSGMPYAPTVGELLSLHSLHVGMHVGQMQVARRKLGKPILF